MLGRTITERKGFRSLSASELENVAGGTGDMEHIFVTGQRPGDPDFGGTGSGVGSGGNETGNTPEPILNPNGGSGTSNLPGAEPVGEGEETNQEDTGEQYRIPSDGPGTGSMPVDVSKGPGQFGSPPPSLESSKFVIGKEIYDSGIYPTLTEKDGEPNGGGVTVKIGF